VICARYGFRTIFATGGVASGLDIAKAVALGATAGGVARKALQALEQGGRSGALSFFEQLELELRTAMLLSGSASLRDLRRAPRILRRELADWQNVDG
jgi:isopentenyl-diphosphate delta-isomerase